MSIFLQFLQNLRDFFSNFTRQYLITHDNFISINERCRDPCPARKRSNMSNIMVIQDVFRIQVEGNVTLLRNESFEMKTVIEFSTILWFLNSRQNFPFVSSFKGLQKS